MIYMVEMDLDDPDREADWHEWYRDHIQTLLTVPGFRASQRLKSIVPSSVPFLALHQVDNFAVLDTPEFRSCGEPVSGGEWAARQVNCRGSRLEGLGSTPDVPAHCHLLVLDGARDVRVPAGISVGWLSNADPDRIDQLCGMAVVRIVPLPLVELAKIDSRVRVYRPITEKIWASA